MVAEDIGMTSLDCFDQDSYYVCHETSPRCYVVHKAIQLDQGQIERVRKSQENGEQVHSEQRAPPPPPMPHWFTDECRRELMMAGDGGGPQTPHCTDLRVPLRYELAFGPITPSFAAAQRMQLLKAQLKAQLEYYFSRENLSTDRYLRCQMDADNFVPISIIATFRKITQLTDDHALIVETLRESHLVEVDERGEKVRAVNERRTIILREITKHDEAELHAILDGGPPYLALHYGLNDSWYVTYATEELTQQAYLHLQQLNRSVCVRIKSGVPAPPTDLLSSIANTHSSSSRAASIDATSLAHDDSSLNSPTNTASPTVFDLGKMLADHGFVPRATYKPPDAPITVPPPRAEQHVSGVELVQAAAAAAAHHALHQSSVSPPPPLTLPLPLPLPFKPPTLTFLPSHTKNATNAQNVPRLMATAPFVPVQQQMNPPANVNAYPLHASSSTCSNANSYRPRGGGGSGGTRSGTQPQSQYPPVEGRAHRGRGGRGRGREGDRRAYGRDGDRATYSGESERGGYGRDGDRRYNREGDNGGYSRQGERGGGGGYYRGERGYGREGENGGVEERSEGGGRREERRDGAAPSFHHNHVVESGTAASLEHPPPHVFNNSYTLHPPYHNYSSPHHNASSSSPRGRWRNGDSTSSSHTSASKREEEKEMKGEEELTPTFNFEETSFPSLRDAPIPQDVARKEKLSFSSVAAGRKAEKKKSYAQTLLS